MKLEDIKKNRTLNIIFKLISAWFFISFLLDFMMRGFVDFIKEWIIYNPGVLFSPNQIGSLGGLVVSGLLTYILWRFFKWSWEDLLKKNEKTR